MVYFDGPEGYNKNAVSARGESARFPLRAGGVGRFQKPVSLKLISAIKNEPFTYARAFCIIKNVVGLLKKDLSDRYK